MDEQSFTFRSRNQDGTINEVEITAEQALDLTARNALTYTPRAEHVLVDDDGTIIWRASAITPPKP